MSQLKKWEWCCQHCGASGAKELEIDWAVPGIISALVLAHSLTSPGCDGNARKRLLVRPLDYSDSRWEEAKRIAKELASKADHSESWMAKWEWLPWP